MSLLLVSAIVKHPKALDLEADDVFMVCQMLFMSRDPSVCYLQPQILADDSRGILHEGCFLETSDFPNLQFAASLQ